MVQVLEIFPTGESGYKSTMTLSQLLAFIHAGVVKIDDDYTRNQASSGGVDMQSMDSLSGLSVKSDNDQDKPISEITDLAIEERTGQSEKSENSESQQRGIEELKRTIRKSRSR